jgi:NAD(P)H-dependent flavin oxidoreductase YrpB (nitropropane dioxygenase family)
MRTKICEMFGVELPVFGFSHCRDVVVEVTKAGGIGVLGITAFTPDQLEMELKWIDDHVGGRPYGVDMLLPAKSEKIQNRGDVIDLEAIIPREHREFAESILSKYNLRPLPARAMIRGRSGEEVAEELLEVSFKHPVALMASALGVAPGHIIEKAHRKGIKVAGLVGKVEHAYRHRDAGADFLIAQGTEAGGHTGDISTLVLTPQVVDAVAPLPVVAAGGVSGGRQLAAALMLGAEGVWCGSVWLTTIQSDTAPEIKKKLLAAKSQDAVRGRYISGKQQRHLRTPWSDAWESREAPAPLPYPLQQILTFDAQARAIRDKVAELMYTPVGQVVGVMERELSVRQVIQDMLTEMAAATERFERVIGSDEATASASASTGAPSK